MMLLDRVWGEREPSALWQLFYCGRSGGRTGSFTSPLLKVLSREEVPVALACCLSDLTVSTTPDPDQNLAIVRRLPAHWGIKSAEITELVGSRPCVGL